MLAETNHNIDLLLDPEAVDILEEAADLHDVFGDLVAATGAVDLIETPDGVTARQNLDTTVSYTGMCVLHEYATGATDDEDLQNLCQALVEVAEPCDEGSLLMEIQDDGSFSEVHAFDPNADLEDLDDDSKVNEDGLERFSNAIKGFVDDHYDPDDN